MSTVRISLLGMFSLFDNAGEDLFSELHLPQGYNKQTFIDTLLLDHGDKCVMYTNPDFTRRAIGVWSAKWANELTNIYNALTAEYNPIHNYDRTEQISDREITDTTNEIDSNDERDGRASNDMTVERKTSAYDSNSYEPNSRDASDIDSTDHTEGEAHSEETGNKDRTYTHAAHIYGNIGVTTNVDMWSQEVDARMSYNLYSRACRLFADDLLLYIY